MASFSGLILLLPVLLITAVISIIFQGSPVFFPHKRLGKDGIIFENCKFDNSTLEIDTETTQTFLGFEKEKTDRNRERVAQALQRRQQVINKNN